MHFGVTLCQFFSPALSIQNMLIIFWIAPNDASIHRLVESSHNWTGRSAKTSPEVLFQQQSMTNLDCLDRGIFHFS